MKQCVRFRPQPTRASARRLISMSLLALLLVCSIFVQGASASHAAPPPTHKPVVRPHGPPHRSNVHVPTRPTRPPKLPSHRTQPAAGLSLQWFNQTGARVISSPAVDNGVVYFADNDSSYDGFLYAVNAASSKLIWSYQLNGGTTCSPTVFNGVVYICHVQVYAIQQDPNNPSQGKLLWTTPFLGAMQARPTVQTVNGNPMLFVGAAGDQQGNSHMYAFDATGNNSNYCQIINNINTCNPLWSFQTGDAVYSSATVATVNGVPTVYFGSDDFNVYALNASTGALIWSYKTGRYVTSSPTVAVVTINVNGQPQTIPVVFIGSYDFNVYALNANTGALIWSFKTSGNVTTSPAVATVTINKQSVSVVYVASIDGYFYAILVTTGTVLWREKTGGGYWDGYQFESSPTVGTVNIGIPPTLTPVVFVGSNTNYVYALNAITGTTVWLYETKWQVESSPAFDSGSNMVYVGSDDGNLYALHADSGAEAWHYTATSQVLAAATNAVVNGIDTVYETALGGAVYALKASDGSLIWRFQSHGEIGNGHLTSGPTVAVVTINVKGQPQTIPVLFVGSNGGEMYALNAATGALLWGEMYVMINGQSTQLGWPNTTPVVATVTINGQSITAVYFGTNDSYIYALNVFDGSYLWRVLMPSGYFGADSPALATNVIIHGQSYTVLYVGSGDQNDPYYGYVYALDASSGAQLWLYQTPPGGYIDASPTVVDNVVYIGSENQTLYALDASSGSVLWSYQENDQGGIIENKSAVVGGVVYFVDDAGYLYALDATKQGNLLWEYQPPSSDLFWSDPTVYAGVVYVGAANDSVYGLSTADGSKLWSFNNPFNPNNIFQAAPVVDAGRVFAGSDDGYLYALSATNSFQAPKLQVSGNQLIDLNNNSQPVVLHGVNRDGTEFGCINSGLTYDGNYNFFPDKHGITDVELAAIRTIWHINAVRVPLNEDCWLNKHMPGGGIGGQAYIDAVTNYVAALNQAGLVAILDLQWSAPKQFRALDLESMPDNDNSLLFWQGVAQTFASNLSVVFDAFNEPDPPKHNGGYDDSTWHCWLNGSSDINGSCYSADPNSTTAGCPNIGNTYNPNHSNSTYFYCVGMQQVVDAIRLYAQTNVIMLGGPNFSKEFNHWSQYLPIDPHTNKPYLNLAIDAHMYKFANYDQKDLVTLLKTYPLIAGEVGAGTIPNPGDPTHEEFILPTMQFLDNPAGDQSIPAQSYLGWFWNTIDTNYHMNMTLNFFPANPALCYGQGFLAHFSGQGPPANCD